jgi:hypothetical protein
MSDSRRAGEPKVRTLAPEPVASAAESWERHTKIADLVQTIRKRRALPLSPAARPVSR